jgi:hypothetical protein
MSRETPIIRALSIRQPYVEAILNGQKTIEYRSRKTNIRERVYIYASKSREADHVFKDFGYTWEECVKGVIVGSIEIVDCMPDLYSIYYQWHLANPLRLDEYLYATNQPQPGIWRPQFDSLTITRSDR